MDKLKKYINDVLGADIKVATFDGANLLPQYLRSGYNFYSLSILSNNFLLFEDKTNDIIPSVIAKQLKQVEDKTGLTVIFTRNQITSYDRKRLVGHRVPFIIPGNQMYLPMLGIDFREFFKNSKLAKDTFSPSTLVILLYILSKRSMVISPAKIIAKELDYSTMTVSRSLKELRDAKLVYRVRNVYRIATENYFELWSKATAFLESPVQKKIFVTSKSIGNRGVVAGLSALAKYSRIAEPNNKVLAFSQHEWREICKHDEIEILPVQEVGAYEIEIWKYKPALFSENGTVNRFSLFLSLKGTTDERVEQAMDEMMEDFEW